MSIQIYRYIVDDIKGKINEGAYGYDEKLPTETELKDMYDTSKTTVRKALKILSDEGYIYSIERKGYFIKPPNTQDYILYFDETDIGLGIDHTEVKAINLINSNDVAALNPQKKALQIITIYYSSEIPVGYDTKYIIYNKGIVIKDKEIEYVNILDILSKQITLYHIEKKLTISGCRVTKETANHLNMKEGQYVVKVEHCYYDEYKKIVAYCVTYYRPSFIKLYATSI